MSTSTTTLADQTTIPHTGKKILVIRNDKLGDFMLIYPALSLLKSALPDSAIYALVPAYTKPMAELCPWIDHAIIDMHDSSVSSALAQARDIRTMQFDAVIDFHPETYTALAVFLSGIPHRYAPASRLVQLFYNHRLTQRRSRSDKPEYIYNVDLARFFLEHHGKQKTTLQPPPYLWFDKEEVAAIRENFKNHHEIINSKSLIFIHPGSGGSAINLSLQQYANLAKNMSKTGNFHFVITAGPDELETARSLSTLLQDVKHTVYHSTKGIVEFSRFIAISDLFISGSTGPLHIAGALDVPTVAFYPARKSATALRWQTLNRSNRRISFSPDTHTDDDDMKTIDVAASALKIVNFMKAI